MTTPIYEIEGYGIRHNRAMAHLVDIGAHDGHGRGIGTVFPTARQIRPKDRSQYKSWPESWDTIAFTLRIRRRVVSLQSLAPAPSRFRPEDGG